MWEADTTVTPQIVCLYGAGEKPHSDTGPGASLWDNYVIFIFFCRFIPSRMVCLCRRRRVDARGGVSVATVVLVTRGRKLDVSLACVDRSHVVHFCSRRTGQMISKGKNVFLSPSVCIFCPFCVFWSNDSCVRALRQTTCEVSPPPHALCKWAKNLGCVAFLVFFWFQS